jgi:biphenyl-2,3-diol 1,2-dioxygenase
MSVVGLGYIGIGVSDVAAWREFAGGILGAHVDDAAAGLRLRFDDRAWRIGIEPTGEDDIVYVGWEVSGPWALDALAAKIEASGAAVVRDAGDLAKKRGVLGVAQFVDPAGLACELFWGPTLLTNKPCVSPVGVSGFVTGDQGLGHIVIGTAKLAEAIAFYRDVLGFGYSDHITMPIGPGMTIPVEFMHCNARHHSVAFAPPPPGPAPRLLHFMLQAAALDDVGFALDRVHKAGIELAMTLGRHSNDEMLSFYAYTPSGFEVEFGWGARTIDRVAWSPSRHDTTSKWGHKFIGHGAPAA